MQFTFTEEQLLAAQSLRELLQDHCTGTALRATASALQSNQPDPSGGTRRQELSELGLTPLLVPEDLGGLGLAPIDFVLLAEEAGRAALPEPLVEHAGVALPLLGELARQQPAARAPLERAMADRGWVLFADYGDAPVAWMSAADTVMRTNKSGDAQLFAIGDLKLQRLEGLDPLRPLAVTTFGGATPLAADSSPQVRAATALASVRGAVFTAAEQLGLAQRLVELAVAYTSERRQFGKPIGSNQALKHLLANVQIRIEFARPVVYAAAAALPVSGAPGAAARVRVTHAKLAAGDAADMAARAAIQCHGAMGYSWELDMQFYAKRAWALNAVHGDRNAMGRRIHEDVLAGACAIGPDRLFVT